MQKESSNALCQIGAGEELFRILILNLRRAAHDLRQVGGEFGLPVAPGCNVRVRTGNVAPRPQSLTRDIGEDAGTVFPARSSDLRVVHAARHRRRPLGAVTHRAGERAQPFGRLRVYLLDKPRHRVERPPGILVGRVEQTLVCPFVARFGQFLYPGPQLAAELAPEQFVPLYVHQDEAAGGVQPRDQFVILSSRR